MGLSPIGDSSASRIESLTQSPSPEACSPPTTPSWPSATPLGRGASASSGSGLRAAADRAATDGTFEPARAAIATSHHRARVRHGQAAPSAVEGRPTRSLKLRRATASRVRDQVVVTFFPAPHSYTGEDVVEISAHGSPVVLRGILRRAIDAGRAARRARRVHAARVSQRQARSDAGGSRGRLIDAVTPLQARAAFDQLEGTLTAAIARDRGGSVRSDGAARSVARFSGEGYHFVGRCTRPRRRLAICAMRVSRSCSAAARARAH